jgi:FtsH-binding integral membrane protein
VVTHVLDGIAAGLRFHPVFAAVAAALAAGVAGYRKAPRSRIWWAAGVVLAGWVVGDGIRIAAQSGQAAYLIAWALTGLAVGYVLPALAGVYVGRQVHKGTGYLSAVAVALMVVAALTALAEPVAAALVKALA